MNVTYDYSGKVVVITGAATGIGREFAISFGKSGANVVVCDFNEEKAMETVNAVIANGTKAIFCKVDVRSVDDIQAMKKKVLDEFGTVDILINNAGVGPGYNKDGSNCSGPPLTRISYEDWQRLFDINLFGAVKVTTELYDIFATKKQGKILFTSSIAAYNPSPLQPHYMASKIAVINFMQALSVEMAAYNVNVNAILPGFVYTPIYAGGGAEEIKKLRPEVFGDCKTGEEVMNRMAAGMSVMQRPQTPEDMANVALFLASDAAKEMTGQAICVDSGVVFRT